MKCRCQHMKLVTKYQYKVSTLKNQVLTHQKKSQNTSMKCRHLAVVVRKRADGSFINTHSNLYSASSQRLVLATLLVQVAHSLVLILCVH